jgi:dolichyl-phosphate-mannose-protein mannosyltransferase
VATTELARSDENASDEVPAAPSPEADRHPNLRDRLVPPMPADGWWGWGGPLLVAAIAAVLRFHRLGIPGSFVFDETYYAKDAWSLLEFGHERNWLPADQSDGLILGGQLQDAWGEGPAYVVHPPLGKWMIAAGEWAFGLTPFGWRFVVALLGTLSVLMIARIARRMFRSTLLGCIAGLLLAVEGLHYVVSRTALLDGILMFWVLAAFGCLVVDRDRARALLASGRKNLGLRPWRIAAGLCLGAACATKWSGLYYVAAFGLLTVLWDVGGRRAAGSGRPWSAMLGRDAIPAFVSIVVVTVATYVVSWSGWFATSGGWDRQWAVGRDSAWSFIPGPLRSLWHYHATMLDFHTGLDSEHPYDSNAWGWLLMTRPVSFFYSTIERGELGCAADQCSREVIGLGTPPLWWAGVFALVVMVWLWLGRRDWRAGAILCAVAAGYLPWFLYDERTIFSFYAVVFSPFIVLAVTMVLGVILGPVGPSAARRTRGAVVVGAYVLVVVAAFAYFYPIYAARVIPYVEWLDHMWLRSWI